MPITSTIINGPLYLPNIKKPIDAKIIFELSSWDKEPNEATFVSGPFIQDIDENGDFSIEVFSNTNGTNNTYYNVSVSYKTVSGLYKKECLGKVSLSGTGPYNLADLNFVDTSTKGSFDLLAEMGAYSTQSKLDVDTVKQLKEDLINLLTSSGGLAGSKLNAVDTIAELRALDTSSITKTLVGDINTGGIFTYKTGDFSNLLDDKYIIAPDSNTSGLTGAWVKILSDHEGSTLNICHNSDFNLSRRHGHTGGAGEVMILDHPFRVGNDPVNCDVTYKTETDGGRRTNLFNKFHPLDRWAVDLGDGIGFCEQVGVDNADVWEPGLTHNERMLVTSPNGLNTQSDFGGGYGNNSYTYQALRTHTNSTSWDIDVKTPIQPGIFEMRPSLWGLYGIRSNFFNLKNSKALRWVQREVSTVIPTLRQFHVGFGQIKNGGIFTISADIINLESGVEELPIKFKAYARRGDGVEVNLFGTNTEPTANVSVLGGRLYWHINLNDPTNEIAALLNYADSTYLSGKKEGIIFEFELPTNRTWDLLIGNVDIRQGYWESIAYRNKPREIELFGARSYFQKSNEDFLPARCSTFIHDSLAGVPQFNSVAFNDIYDRYGILKEVHTNWGGTNRAFPRNEHEQPNRIFITIPIEREAKGKPSVPNVIFDTPLVSNPQESQIKIYAGIDSALGFGDLNTKRQQAHIFDYQGVGNQPRLYARRSQVEIQVFGATQRGFKINPAFRDPNTATNPYLAYEDFSQVRTIGATQDNLGSSFPQLHIGKTYQWAWFSTGFGNDSYYLALANNAFPNLIIGESLSVGDIRKIPTSRAYVEVVKAHTCDLTTLAALDDIRFRPYGQIEMPYKILMDETVELDDQSIDDPKTMTGGHWFFGDESGLGFKTLYVVMDSGDVNPSSAANRLKLLSYSNQSSLFDTILLHYSADIDLLS